ncbi:MAG: TIM barrel protein [Verrucomicrobia bacterium]|nr:TIM barrel protein [Verrucomicrobiota bacterium]
MPLWKKAYHANCWGALGGEPVGVTSVKNLFYRTFGDMNRAIAEIAQAGYQAIELFDGNLVDYEHNLSGLRGRLDQAGLRLVAVYSGGNFVFPDILSEELWRIRKAADLAAELGAEHLVVGGGAQKTVPATDEDYDRLAEALDKVVDAVEQRGLLAHYHPHLTTIVERPEQIKKVFSRSRICFCPDTAHLAAAGGNPAQLILDHAGRIRYVHLKDFRRQPFEFLPLGRGELDMKGILDALVRINYSGWIAVELDAYDDPKAGAEISMQYLESFEKRLES